MKTPPGQSQTFFFFSSVVLPSRTVQSQLTSDLGPEFDPEPNIESRYIDG